MGGEKRRRGIHQRAAPPGRDVRLSAIYAAPYVRMRSGWELMKPRADMVLDKNAGFKPTFKAEIGGSDE